MKSSLLRTASVGFLILSFLGLSSSYADHAPTIDEVLFPSSHLSITTDAAIVKKDGKVLYERYANGYSAESKHVSWSVAKSILGIMTGIAVERGYLKYTDPVRKWFPAFTGTATVLDLIQMSSGIDFQEEYLGLPVRADVVRMLYLDGPKQGFADYVVSRPLRGKDAEPGKHFYYSSGDTAVLSEILRLSMPKRVYDTFPWDAIFNPLGIRGAVFERDRKGAFIGSSYMYLRIKDYLKLGELVMNRGVFRGKRIIPKSYFKLMTEVAPGVNVAAVDGATYTTAYSAQARTNLPIPGRGCGSEFPDLPLDTVILFGHQGMVIAGSPSQKLVVLRVSVDRGSMNIRGNYFTAVRQFLKGRGKDIDASLPTDTRKCITPWEVAMRTVQAQRRVALKEYKRTPTVLRQVITKEFCSCIFVLGRTEEQCVADQRNTFPIVPKFTIDRKAKTVSAGEDFVSLARYKGGRDGCRLQSGTLGYNP